MDISVIQSIAQGMGLAPMLDSFTEETYLALCTLPEAHVSELLQSVAFKVAKGTLTNPSNYICAAVSRGYTPNDSFKGAKGYSSGKGYSPAGKGPSYDSSGWYSSTPAGAQSDPDAGNLALQAAMQSATSAGVQLTQEAANSLMTVPSTTAADILEYVAVKYHELRDPSNYIIATIFKKGQQKGDKGYDSYGDKGGGKGKFKGPRPLKSIPQDLTPLERAVVDLNQEALWGAQEIDFNTVLALRCLPQHEAMAILTSFGGKGRSGKGGDIFNINNYLQAAVAKTQRGSDDWGTSVARIGAQWGVSNTAGYEAFDHPEKRMRLE